MISDIEKLLTYFGIENWLVQTIVAILLLCSIGFTIVQAIIKFLQWLYKVYINRKISKDLHPFYSYLEVNNATKYFIPTKFQNVPPSQDEEPGRSYIIAAKQKLISLFIKKAFNQSVDDDKYYIVLADSGMGKTTFMINLYHKYKYGFRWPWSARHNIMLFPLGNKNSLDYIRNLDKNKRKNTILLLDAFDEDNQAVKDYSKRLNEIIELTWDFRDVVITCRTQFFPDSQSEPYETGRLKFGPDGGKHRFRKLYISVFSDADIKAYLKKKFSVFLFLRSKKYYKGSSLVSLSPNLMIRPMLLNHIEDLVNNDTDYSHRFQIYHTLISEWLKREANKPGIVSKYKKSDVYEKLLFDFSSKLAKQIYLFGNDISRQKGVVGNIEDIIKNEKFIPDLELSEQTSRSLLNRNAIGKYKFSHKSIYEYFLAIQIFEDEEFRKSFRFEENLDTCKYFFNEMRLHHPRYSSIYFDGEELIKINATKIRESNTNQSKGLKKEKKYSNFIFTFGNTGVGKSTLLASLAKLLSEETVMRINPSNKIGSSLLMGEWIHKLKKGNFPARTINKDVVEVDLAAEFIKGNNDIIPFTFLEMSGERLSQMNIIKNNNSVDEDYVHYLERSDAFIVVTDIKSADRDDSMIWRFLLYLSNLDRDNVAIALVITKWDLMTSNITFKEFVKNNMPKTYLWLTSNGFNKVVAFSFSVGSVSISDQELPNKILSYDSKDAKKIVQWLYEVL